MIKNLVIDTIIQVNEHPDTPNEDIIHQIEKATDEIINSLDDKSTNQIECEHICKNCEHWFKDTRTCDSTAFVYTGNGEPMPNYGLGYWDTDSYHAGFQTGENFGCIHWVKR